MSVRVYRCLKSLDPFKAVIYLMDFAICGINAHNNFEDLKKYDGSSKINGNSDIGKRNKNLSMDQHLAQKNSHFVELSTISEDNEQISSEKNTTIPCSLLRTRLWSRHNILSACADTSSTLVSSMASIKLDDNNANDSHKQCESVV
ncbi:unnamed protein product [Medioppia subpectinata]|uniref:Uncharacterized protein n=1 Tax=Medioppia subpectinata TaxID=1979941 RepID=A0A7R9KIF8_9ACAR|nr:unnamed protein product [Medioppia subpectinata]CAG2104283.1 unnamed protein product [Medioppia subpectinata]